MACGLFHLERADRATSSVISDAARQLGLCRRAQDRRKGRVVEVQPRCIYGTQQALAAALAASPASQAVNTAFVERVNGTDRHLNARKGRKTYRFSKEVDMHVAQSWLSVTYYNFCWDHRGLRCQQPDGTFQHRSPAMAAGLSNCILTIHDLTHYPVIRWYPIT